MAVFITGAETDRIRMLQSTDDLVHVFPEFSETPSGRVGLVFDQTNFFASAGGQDSDQGLIKLSSSVVS